MQHLHRVTEALGIACSVFSQGGGGARCKAFSLSSLAILLTFDTVM